MCSSCYEDVVSCADVFVCVLLYFYLCEDEFQSFFEKWGHFGQFTLSKGCLKVIILKVCSHRK